MQTTPDQFIAYAPRITKPGGPVRHFVEFSGPRWAVEWEVSQSANPSSFSVAGPYGGVVNVGTEVITAPTSCRDVLNGKVYVNVTYPG